jgi:hypothetical protein
LHALKRPQGHICHEEKVSSAASRGYVWKVIADPTRGKDDPGMFYGRLFRMVDLRTDRDEKSTWPDGIVFEDVASGCRLAYQKGVLVDLANSTVVGRKPRVRVRNHRSISESNEKGAEVSNKSLSNSFLSQMRRFVLVRGEDLTGVSGTGEVAEGTVFSDGLVVIHWLREPFAMGVYQALEDVLSVHGHEGRTQLQYIDPGESQ